MLPLLQRHPFDLAVLGSIVASHFELPGSPVFGIGVALEPRASETGEICHSFFTDNASEATGSKTFSCGTTDDPSAGFDEASYLKNFTLIDYDYTQESSEQSFWYTRIKNSNDIEHQWNDPYFGRASNQILIEYIHKLEFDGEFVGVVFVDISIDKLAGILNGPSTAKSASDYKLLVSDRGIIISPDVLIEETGFHITLP